jgi:DNA-binding response OmpR family regulator
MGNKILLIDDDRDFVELNQITLESRGYRITTAYNGEEGLKKALQEKPDLIVLDVMMTTRTEGFDVARKLREVEELKETPIIMVSAIREEMDISRKIKSDKNWLPVTEFIEKPFPPDKLLKKIEQLLSKNN